MSGPRVSIFADAAALARAAAADLVREARTRIAERERFAVALAGGTTPSAAYRVLAGLAPDAAPDWSRIDVFVGDERDVPPDHPESNYRMMRECLLDTVRVGSVTRFRTEWGSPGRICDAFEQAARERLPEGPDGVPRFDLVWLGLGPDAHTASLFPGSPLLETSTSFAAAVHVEKLGARRYTLTPRALNAAARITFLVAGEGKAAALATVLQEREPVAHAPARIVRPVRGDVEWLVDRAAASALDGESRRRPGR